ncbi:hypothetical protein BC937DRAFT_93785 [Endogone sp. FLAS-F59071]|nr:hypothetical protein BC937DRAFT_93785 [Endogone sp. FLAS-F59071]|eukprot:RUS14460.1 hypothetical protein BC937DRAFT_93785 [Endogone sp. FLAS-F59071]
MGYTVSWLFATGAEWIPFDIPTQDLLESCWERGVDYSFAIDSHFGSTNVLIHFHELYVAQGPIRFAIWCPNSWQVISPSRKVLGCDADI